MTLRRWLVVAIVCAARAQEDDEDGPQKSKRDIVGQYAYCMEDNCYELLGVAKDAGGLSIKRSYRKLATEWHPDKTTHPDKSYAKQLFQKYANAYEVLSSPEMRDNYDYLLDHPYEFPMHFMRFSRAKYVPKTDLRVVLLFTVAILSTIQYYFLKSKYELSVKAVKSSPRYQERLKAVMAEEFKVGAKKAGGSAKAKAVKGDKADEARKAAEAKLEDEIMSALVAPKYQDTVGWQVFVLPLTCYYSGTANVSWFLRFKIRREEADDAEKERLTMKALKMTTEEWAEYTEAEQAEFIALELWDQDKLAAYEEEEAREARKSGSKNAKQKREERAAKRRTGKFVMDE